MSNRVAFFRLEGTLVSSSALASVSHFAMNAQGFRERIFRFGYVAASAPIFGILGQNDRNLATRVSYSGLRNMSEDRLFLLGEEFAEKLKKKELASGKELLRKARKEKYRIVVLTELLSQVVTPLISHFRGVDDVICNEMEVRAGKATGRLISPIIGGHETASVVQEYSLKHNINLEQSVFYSGYAADLLTLSMFGQPCAVNPDYTLRRAAVGARWAILDYQV